MAKFTLIIRDLTTGLTGWHHVTGETLYAAFEEWNDEVPAARGSVELAGAFEGHITPLWWEE